MEIIFNSNIKANSTTNMDFEANDGTVISTNISASTSTRSEFKIIASIITITVLLLIGAGIYEILSMNYNSEARFDCTNFYRGVMKHYIKNFVFAGFYTVLFIPLIKNRQNVDVGTLILWGYMQFMTLFCTQLAFVLSSKHNNDCVNDGIVDGETCEELCKDKYQLLWNSYKLEWALLYLNLSYTLLNFLQPIILLIGQFIYNCGTFWGIIKK